MRCISSPNKNSMNFLGSGFCTVHDANSVILYHSASLGR